MVKSQLTNERFLSYALIGITTLFLASTVFVGLYYSIVRISLPYSAAQNLNHLVQAREKALLEIVSEQKKQLENLSAHQEFITTFHALDQAFSEGKESAAYKKPEGQLDQFFNQYRTVFNYKDLFLVRLDGTIFYVSKGEVIGKNILKEGYGSALAQSLERIFLTYTIDISEFAIDPLLKEPALFISQPVFHQGTFIGIIVAQVDQELLYKVIQNYHDLGRTGDIFVTKNIGERVLFVAPSRLYSNVTFKKITNPDRDANTPARKASLGYQGFGTVIDSFNVKIAAAWLFVPQLDWGMAAGIQFIEILAPLATVWWLFVGLLVISLFSLLVFGWRFRNSRKIQAFKSYVFSRPVIHVFLIVCLTGAALVSIILMVRHSKTYNVIFNRTKDRALIKTHVQGQLINQYITEVEKIAQALARDLQEGALADESIRVRLDRDLKELPDIRSITVAYAPFAYNPKQRLFGFVAQRSDNHVQIADLTYDYMIPVPEEDITHGWYMATIKQGVYWSNPYVNKETMHREILYGITFYKSHSSEPAGVIVIAYDLSRIVDHVRSIEIGKTGYAVILSSKGTFIYHPLAQYLKDNVSIFDLAREQNNPELKDIADAMISGKTGFSYYYDHNTKLKHWIAYEPIVQPHWIIAGLFSQEALELPYEILHKQTIWIIISVVITLLLASMLMAHLEQGDMASMRKWAILSAVILASALIFFWVITRRHPYEPPLDSTIVRDQTNLDKYTEFLALDAEQRNEKKPIIVPTGVLLYTLSFSNSNKVSVSGYIWQKVTKDAESLAGIRLPEASEVTIKEIVRKKINDHQTLVGWNISAQFVQPHHYSWFPFDPTHLNIVMSSANFEENVVLVPDFEGYQSLDVDPIPGVTNKISVSGFDIERTFFSFRLLPPYDDVGLETLKKVTEKVQLHYNIILKRNLTNPLIIFMLPLLIILFSIFAIFTISFRERSNFDVFKTLTSYTGVFFSVVILHQTLRNQYQAGELLYLEYLFFFSYITVLLLVLHALILKVSHYSHFVNTKITPLLRLFFWPLQFALWFIVTMIVFYNMR